MSEEKTEGPEQSRRGEGPEQSRRTVEKYYIEVAASTKKRFIIGLVGGLGWGIGLTLGTGVILYLVGLIVTKIDFVPILGQFMADVIKSAESNLNSR